MPWDDQRFGHRWLAEFGLNPSLVHANHGSFGAVPEPVRCAQRAIQDDLRANPCGFFRSQYPTLIRDAAGRVADFLGGQAQDWVFVENATSAANAIIASTDLVPGDEVLTTDQVYGAVRKAIVQRCRQTGVRLVEARIALPVSRPDDIVTAVTAAASDRTRLVVLDHISSPCGIGFPVAALCTHFREKHIPVFIDGAHAPGNIDVDVSALGADYYAGNAHKWLCAPHGAGMLWCRPDRQPGVQPLVVSHGHGWGFTQAFDWPGTRDPSAWLSVPAAIDFHDAAGGAKLRSRNHQVACSAAQQLADEFATVLAAPHTMHCAMAALRLPFAQSLPFDQTEALQQKLQTDHNIVVSITSAGGANWLRLSAAIYSDVEDLVKAGRLVWQAVEEIANDD